MCFVSAQLFNATVQELSNEQDDDFTMLRVEVPDRPGLLTDLVKSLKCEARQTCLSGGLERLKRHVV